MWEKRGGSFEAKPKGSHHLLGVEQDTHLETVEPPSGDGTTQLLIVLGWGIWGICGGVGKNGGGGGVAELFLHRQPSSFCWNMDAYITKKHFFGLICFKAPPICPSGSPVGFGFSCWFPRQPT